MKKNLLFSLVMLASGSLLAADANPKDDVTAAASAVSGAASYSWHITTDMGPNAQFTPGPVDGKTEKDGYTLVTMSFNDNTTEILVKGTNSAVKTQDNGWQTAAEASQGEGLIPPAPDAAGSHPRRRLPLLRAASPAPRGGGCGRGRCRSPAW